MDLLEQVPDWLLRPIPANATIDAKLLEQIDELAKMLPSSIGQLHQVLTRVMNFCEYDAAANRACAHVWLMLEHFYMGSEPAVRSGLLTFATQHMVEQARFRVCRRLSKDPDATVRTRVRRMVRRREIKEVALPARPEGDWDPTGWLKGIDSNRQQAVARHPAGVKVQAKHGVPEITTIKQLRELLGIRSEKQLGWFLLASDKNAGPYEKFTIPKRDGSKRDICAPKKQLKWVQRLILENILEHIPAHPAAHGFITERSTVTNAGPHLGAAVILKFDLTDFFPTIHHYRVIGLFASLGYAVGNTKFAATDKAKQIAPTLARLCCYTPDPEAWGTALLPQGAPTSPAISNLVCRRLDARLDGLASCYQGTYTRYADDLTFSFKEPDLDVGRFRWWVDQICHQEGFFINQKKFRVIRSAQRQVVTGIVVNDELHIPRDQRRRFRAMLHNCKKNGVAAEALRNPKLIGYLRGFASYIHMVQPEEGARLLKEVEELLGGQQPQ